MESLGRGTWSWTWLARLGRAARFPVTLCWDHHDARYEGVPAIEGSALEFRFVLLDGTFLGGDARAPEFSGDNEAVSGENEAVAGEFSGENASEERAEGSRGISEADQRLGKVLAGVVFV